MEFDAAGSLRWKNDPKSRRHQTNRLIDAMRPRLLFFIVRKNTYFTPSPFTVILGPNNDPCH